MKIRHLALTISIFALILLITNASNNIDFANMIIKAIQ